MRNPAKSVTFMWQPRWRALLNASADVPAIVTAGVRRREPTADQLREKLARLLAMDDAGERAVLPEQTHPGVLHHEYENAPGAQ